MDIEAKIYLFINGLYETKNKEYSNSDCSYNLAYIFNSFEEYKSYFTNNGYKNIDNYILNICSIKITKKGSVIALKGLCDYVISKNQSFSDNTIIHNNNEIKFGSEEMSNKIEQDKKRLNLIKRF